MGRLVDLVIPHSLKFSRDEYANYVIQCILNRQDQALNERVHGILKEHYLELINYKFSSNVAEKVSYMQLKLYQ